MGEEDSSKRCIMLFVVLGCCIVFMRCLSKLSGGEESRTSKAVRDDTPNIDIAVVAGVPELDQDVSARAIEDGQRAFSDGVQLNLGIRTPADQT